MDGSSFTERALEELWNLFRQRRGSIAAAQRHLGVSKSFFQDWKRGKSVVTLSKLVDTLDYLGVEPSAFFAKVAGSKKQRGTYFGGRPPRGVELFDQRMREEGINLE